MEIKNHWESIYTTTTPNEESWFQEHPAVSRELIRHTALPKSSPIIDVGGGTSRLVDDLTADGYSDLTVLDLSATALARTRERLEAGASSSVTFIEADVTAAVLPRQKFGIWHDRAVFHFLTEAADRRRYVEQMRRAVIPGGHVVIATFSLDGPSQCSGLPVVRYSCESLQWEIGASFELVEETHESHRTPFETVQSFIYCRFRHAP